MGQGRVAGLLLGILVFAALPMPSEATSAGGVIERACAEESSTRSLGAPSATSVRIQNDRLDTVSTYWLDYTGQRVFYNTLPPGWWVQQPTYDTHPWVIIGSSGECLGIYIATPNAGQVILTATPSPPRALTGMPGPGPGDARIQWQAPATNGGYSVSAYRIYRDLGAGEQYIGSVSGGANNMLDSGLGSGTSVRYRVSAVNAAGESTRSNLVTVVTYAPPGPPNSFDATPGDELGEVVLTWSPPSTTGGLPVSTYRLYRGTTPDSLSFFAEFPARSIWNDVGLDPLRTYHYAIAARNGAGEGPRAPITCTKPGPWLEALDPGCTLPSPP